MSKDTVTVIKSVNYSEADKILTVFGKYNGKFSIMAKGIRKITSRNRGNMQTLSTSEISYYEGKGLPILTESQLISSQDIDSHINIENIERLLYILNKFLVEGEENKKIFKLLQSVLEEDLTVERVNKFRLRILKELGFLSDFDVCSSCHTKKDLQYFDPNDFSILCKKCYSTKSKGVKLSKDIYKNPVFTDSLDRYIKKIVEEI
ncbi:MAG: DNA repair protein RecO [Candidatus Dojkabacteria bacterium]|nr:DNA repair protein RecO [Candidatus Dojkabacteria bacterium]